MRILLPSIVDPADRAGGAWTVTRELIRLLEQGPLAADVEVVPLPGYAGLARRSRQAAAIAASLISPLPAKVAFARDRRLRAEFRAALVARPPDLVLVNGADLLWLLRDVPRTVPAALVAHNIESHLLAAQIAQISATGGHLRPFGWWAARECRRLRDFELVGLGHVGRVVFLSSADETYAREQVPGLRTMTLPPVFGDPPTPRAPVSGVPSGRLELGMLANFEWWPNTHGLRWFLREVFPSAPARTRLHLYGNGGRSAAGSDPRIVAHGFVNDLAEVWSTCDFMICPIRAGSGVCVKVAESVYHGMPILATPTAVRGLPIAPSSALAVFDHSEEWIRFLHRDADGFAREVVPPEVAERFHAANYTEDLAAFLGEPTSALAITEPPVLRGTGERGN